MNQTTTTAAALELDRYASKGEAAAARRLLRHALRLGYAVSVNDGEEWTVKHSTDFAELEGALASTGQDTLRFTRDGAGMGYAYLIYGNDPDGSELIADHTDGQPMNELYALTYNA